MGLEREAMRSILMEVAELAAYSSIVVGELPRMIRSEAEDLLGGGRHAGHAAARVSVQLIQSSR